MTTVAIKNIEKRYAFRSATESWRLTDYLGGALHGGWEEPPPGPTKCLTDDVQSLTPLGG